MAPLLFGYVAAILATTWLPPLEPLACATAAAALVALMWRGWPLVAGALIGFIIATGLDRDALDHRLAACVDGATVEFVGDVVGLPRGSARQSQFDLAPDAAEPWPVCAGALPRRLHLTWYDGPAVTPGDRWQLRVKLRAIRGHQNPGGFDYEAWSLANRIDGAGTVRYGERRNATHRSAWDRLRLDLRGRFAAMPIRHAGILLALLTGDAALMSEADWALFRSTGTVHLMVISGLHLSIVAAAGVGIGRALARMMPRCLARAGSLPPAIACGGLLITLYACLAGWGIPVRRSWIATLLVLLLLSLGRRASLPMALLWVIAIVLTHDPLAPIQSRFWLSFIAVAVLLARFGARVERRSMLTTLVAAQVVLAFAMVPALTATVGSVAWIAPLANLVAVPVISIIIVPLDLIVGAIVTVTRDADVWLVHALDTIVGWVVAYLNGLAQFGWVAWRSERGAFATACSAIGSCLIVLPLSWRHRLWLLPCVLLPLLPLNARMQDSVFEVTVFDVGQGLAVEVATARHRLLYDAGPRFPSGFDLGSAVVVPSLRRETGPLDAVILSHSDMDHIGGYEAVARSFAVRTLLGGERVNGHDELRRCRVGQGWQWDGVRFRMLHPGRNLAADNDRSCVLLIDNGRRRVLLPGDVTRIGEQTLIATLPRHRLDLLVAAHHGSRSSSTPAFVARTAPRLVVFSAGYMNRFGHPHADVICRFADAGARQFLTASAGALRWRSDRPAAIGQWRYRSPPFWRVGTWDAGWPSNSSSATGSGSLDCPAGTQGK
jgi:competence protein ComEC